MIKDLQYHPLNEENIHIDFVKISLTEKIKVSVPIILGGEAKGVKEGGVLEQILWNLEIEGLATDIPERIEVEISNLGIGDSIHAGDIKLAENLKLITPPISTVATVVKKVEEEVAAPGTAEAVPAGPEVIKEKKESEEKGEETVKEKDKETAKEKE